MACLVSDCERKVVARGLCDMHRKRLARHGHLESTRPDDWGQRESHPLYRTWCGMRRRCSDVTSKDYVNYGARGIEVCSRWAGDFWAFVEDMGEKPSPSHSVDRIDNKLGYSPDNCRWATPSEQARNRKERALVENDVVVIKALSKSGVTASAIARALNVNYDNVRHVILGNIWKDVKP